MSLQAARKDRAVLEREKRFLAAHAAGHDRIYRYFRRRTDNGATAEDLCSEVFRIAWEKSATDNLSVMVLFGMAKNVLRNHDRSLLRSANLLGALRSERYNAATSRDSPVQEALERLNPDEREILLLTYWDGLTSKEISNLLDTSATAIRMRLHRARKALSHLIQTQTQGEEL